MATSPMRSEILADEIQFLRAYWFWFLVLGIVQIVLGSLAIGWACLYEITEIATWLFGFVMLVAGISEVITSFRNRSGGMVMHLLLGLLYAIVGVMIIDNPTRGAVQLTLIISIFLMVGGLYRIAFALMHRIAGAPWVLLNGVVTLLLGLMIYKQWPYSGLWVIGLFVGIELILNGWTWLMLAALMRQKA